MDSIKLQAIVTSLDINYQRGKSITLEVGESERSKRKLFLLWTVLAVLASVTLILFLIWRVKSPIDYQQILLIISTSCSIIFFVYQMSKTHVTVPYTFQKIEFLSNEIKVHQKKTLRTIPMNIPLECTFTLNQENPRPQINMAISNGHSVQFQLDSMQDFPVVTDAIADVYNLQFQRHEAVNDFVEKLTFGNIERDDSINQTIVSF